MKSFHELSRRARLQRFRQLAEIALGHYELGPASLSLLRYFANTTYRVDVAGEAVRLVTHAPYLPGRYLLRILASDNWDKALGEMTWLAALSGDAGLPVPTPVPTINGDLLLRIATPGIPNGRIVSLNGYLPVHSLPDSQLKHLDLFLAADYATSVLWATAFIHDDPSRQSEYEAWRNEN